MATDIKKPTHFLPWEQLAHENETERAYAMFIVYRDMGSVRSLSSACLQIYPRDPENPRKQAIVGNVAELSRRFRWKERAIAYDMELDRQRRASQITEIRKMEQRHAGIARELQNKALLRLMNMPLEEMGPSHVLNFLSEAIRIEREAMGCKETIQVENINRDPAEGAVEKTESPSNIRMILEILAQRGALPKGVMEMLPGPEAVIDIEVVDDVSTETNPG